MEQIAVVIQSLSPSDVADIALVSVLFYMTSFLFRGTQAVTLFRGIALIVIGLIAIATIFNLPALSWLLVNSLTALVIAIPVIFQPEIRRVLERLGRGTIFGTRRAPDEIRIAVIDAICAAAGKLSGSRHGALIVVQRSSDLTEYIRSGVQLDSLISADLLGTIFFPKTELHDGAVIIDSYGRIASASSLLPITASRNLPDLNLGTRHRAAVGISEIGDALCVIVSEETGRIGIANGGRLIMDLDANRLKVILGGYYGPDDESTLPLMSRLRGALQGVSLRVQTRRSQSASP